MNINEIKKDLYRSKNMAKFSHYVSGNLYYTVVLVDGKYQFPISTIEKTKLQFCENIEAMKLSMDLGTTVFCAEMRGSELIRWISKAIETNEFIKVN